MNRPIDNLPDFKSVTSEAQLIRETVLFLFRQGSRSSSIGGCALRGRFYTACALGCWIPNDQYDGVMDHDSTMGWEFIGVLGDLGLSDLVNFATTYREALENLQGFHDYTMSATTASAFRESWVNFCAEYPPYAGIEIDLRDNEFGMYTGGDL